MPFTVLKVSKTAEGLIEIAGEFPDETEAHKFLETARSGEDTDDFDYIIEPPPTATTG